MNRIRKQVGPEVFASLRRWVLVEVVRKRGGGAPFAGSCIADPRLHDGTATFLHSGAESLLGSLQRRQAYAHLAALHAVLVGETDAQPAFQIPPHSRPSWVQVRPRKLLTA